MDVQEQFDALDEKYGKLAKLAIGELARQYLHELQDMPDGHIKAAVFHGPVSQGSRGKETKPMGPEWPQEMHIIDWLRNSYSELPAEPYHVVYPQYDNGVKALDRRMTVEERQLISRFAQDSIASKNDRKCFATNVLARHEECARGVFPSWF